MAACEAQSKLAKSTAQYIKEIGLEEVSSSDKRLKTRQVDFSFQQPMEHGDGHQISQAEVSVSAPLLSILPIPALRIEDVEVEFNMEVKSSAKTKSGHDESATAAASFGWGPFSASVQGTISSHQEQTRKSDNSAKYHVKVSAKQAETPEGLSKILDLLSGSVRPHSVKPLPAKGDPVVEDRAEEGGTG